MRVDSDVLQRAKAGNHDATIEVLAAQYPATYRMSHALSGRADVGDGIVNFVMKQSFRVVEKWADEYAPQRWFRHHTLLTVRRASRWKPDATKDTLFQDPDAKSDGAQTEYVAFVRALRGLPQQQVEAFVLAHGERLDARDLAVAMDCSTTAAAIHLREAEERLKKLSGAQFELLVGRMRTAYEALTPSRDLVLSRVGGTLRRQFWPRLLRRLSKLLILGAIFGAIAWALYRWWPQVVEFMRSILNRVGVA